MARRTFTLNPPPCVWAPRPPTSTMWGRLPETLAEAAGGTGQREGPGGDRWPGHPGPEAARGRPPPGPQEAGGCSAARWTGPGEKPAAPTQAGTGQVTARSLPGHPQRGPGRPAPHGPVGGVSCVPRYPGTARATRHLRKVSNKSNRGHETLGSRGVTRAGGRARGPGSRAAPHGQATATQRPLPPLPPGGAQSDL